MGSGFVARILLLLLDPASWFSIVDSNESSYTIRSLVLSGDTVWYEGVWTYGILGNSRRAPFAVLLGFVDVELCLECF